MNRRHFLGLSAMGSLGLSQRAFASNVPAGGRKIILVYNYGGWDPTRVFAAEFDNRAVDMERSAELAQVGSLHFVDHENRPSVREFFTRFGGDSVFLNGVLVPSVAHENCLKLSLTGTSADGAADWPALIAGDRIQAHALPHIVVGGPSFPGDHGAAVTRRGWASRAGALLARNQWKVRGREPPAPTAAQCPRAARRPSETARCKPSERAPRRWPSSPPRVGSGARSRSRRSVRSADTSRC